MKRKRITAYIKVPWEPKKVLSLEEDRKDGLATVKKRFEQKT